MEEERGQCGDDAFPGSSCLRSEVRRGENENRSTLLPEAVADLQSCSLAGVRASGRAVVQRRNVAVRFVRWCRVGLRNGWHRHRMALRGASASQLPPPLTAFDASSERLCREEGVPDHPSVLFSGAATTARSAALSRECTRGSWAVVCLVCSSVSSAPSAPWRRAFEGSGRGKRQEGRGKRQERRAKSERGEGNLETGDILADACSRAYSPHLSPTFSSPAQQLLLQ